MNACSKSKNEPVKPQTALNIVVKKNDRLSTGEIIEKDVSVAVIHIWKSTSNGDIRIKSYFDAIEGYAYNYITNQSVKADYSFLYKSSVIQKLDPGYYLVYVLLDNNIGAGSMAYTSAIFNVTEGQYLTQKKVFTTHAITASYESWDAHE